MRNANMEFKYLDMAFEAEQAESAEGSQENGTENEAENTSDTMTMTKEEFNDMVDRIISNRLNRERKEAEKKSKAAAEAARLEKMTAEQKLQEKADALQRKIDELERKEALAEMSKSARKMLNDEKIVLPDEIVNVLVTQDADTTKTNIASFVKVFKQAVQDNVAEQLKGKTPKAAGTVNKTSMTKEEILNIEDTFERQKKISENLSLFQK